MQGGGGSRSTGKSRALDINVIQNSERSERDSGSDQCRELPVSLDRSRNKFGMTLAEPTAERYPQSDPGGNLTKEVSTKAVKSSSLRADECRRGNPGTECHPQGLNMTF